MEAVLTMQPRRAFKPARAALQTRIVPVRLMSSVSAKATGSCSTPRRMTPAQLTTTSSSPSPATSATTAAPSRTSRRRTSMPGVPRAASTSASVAPVATTASPAAAKARAMPAPMPLVAPVTRTRRAAASMSGREDVAGLQGDVGRDRRQVGEQLGLGPHHVEDVLRLDVLVDVERRLDDAQPAQAVLRRPERAVVVRRETPVVLLDVELHRRLGDFGLAARDPARRHLRRLLRVGPHPLVGLGDGGKKPLDRVAVLLDPGARGDVVAEVGDQVAAADDEVGARNVLLRDDGPRIPTRE